MLEPGAPIGMGELEQGIIVPVLSGGFLALLLKCRLDGVADQLLPGRLLPLQMLPCQLILLQKLTIAGQYTSRSPFGAETFRHYSSRGLGRRLVGIMGVVEPGLEAILGPVLPAEAV
jgi:hypothetical protein